MCAGGAVMEDRRCPCCEDWFRPRPQTPKQCYCTKPACQRERRRRWQHAKRHSDADYRDNERRANRAWAATHTEYWRAWREQHPEYCEQNRRQQRLRNQRRGQTAAIAKMDASTTALRVSPGTYRLMPTGPAGIANEDAWTVEIAVISAPYRRGGGTRDGLQREDVIGRRAGGG